MAQWLAMKATTLNGESELIAAAVASGQRDAVIADSLGLSHRTYYRRKALPETQQLIAEYRREAAQQIRDGVVGAALSGLERLRRIVEDPDSSDSAAVAASRYLVDLAIGSGGLAIARPEPGEACGTCGHEPADPEAKAATVELIRARLAEMSKNMATAPPMELEAAS
jgi:hypothetical protein